MYRIILTKNLITINFTFIFVRFLSNQLDKINIYLFDYEICCKSFQAPILRLDDYHRIEIRIKFKFREKG